MIVPYNTDAPLYHFPFATIGVIVVNVLLYVPVFNLGDPYKSPVQEQAEYAEDEFVQDASDDFVPVIRQPDSPPTKTIWRLMTVEFGTVKPWQWITASYMHIGFFHLLGNMVLLWGFGLVVEGKIGWWRFLLVYNLIGAAGWGLVQFIMLFADSGIGLGSSLPIFGLIAVALVWAPANEMQCLIFVSLRPIMFEVSVMVFAMMSLFLQVAISVFYLMFTSDDGLGIRMTSEFLHLIGAFFGFIVGIGMLRRKLVDCENWDMFSVWQGKHQKLIADDRKDVGDALEIIKRQERARYGLNVESSPVPKARLDSGQARSSGSFGSITEPMELAPSKMFDFSQSLGAPYMERLQKLLSAGDGRSAWELVQSEGALEPELAGSEYLRMIAALRNQRAWNESAAAMEYYLQRYREKQTTMRLALAQILLQFLDKPAEARAQLEWVNAGSLDPKERAYFDKLQAALGPEKA